VCANAQPKSVFKDKKANEFVSFFHDNYAVVPADKASNNIAFVCTNYYYGCLVKDIGIFKNSA